MTIPKWTMPTEKDLEQLHKDTHDHLKTLKDIPTDWWNAGFYHGAIWGVNWLRDRMKPVTIAPISDDELTNEACKKYYAAVRENGESDISGQVRLVTARLAYEAGWRAAEARMMKGTE